MDIIQVLLVVAIFIFVSDFIEHDFIIPFKITKLKAQKTKHEANLERLGAALSDEIPMSAKELKVLKRQICEYEMLQKQADEYEDKMFMLCGALRPREERCYNDWNPRK